MTEITWPCGGHKYEDGVGVVCGACHDAEVDRLKRGLAERDERVRELEAVVAQVIKSCDDQRDRKLIARMCSRALAASAPAGEQEKTSEGDVGREDHSSAPNSTSPPAEAPQVSGVPSGIPTCDDCGEEFDPMFGVCRNVLHKQRGDTQETQAAEGEAMTPERLSYLMQENLLRGECSATRDELHWIFTLRLDRELRAEDAERNAQSLEDSNAEDFRILREAMTAACIEYAGPQDAYSIARHFTLALFAAEAKLAMAVQALEFYAATSTYRPHIESGPISEDCDRSLTTKDLDFGVAGQCARATLRALGIDPTKEQEK